MAAFESAVLSSKGPLPRVTRVPLTVSDHLSRKVSTSVMSKLSHWFPPGKVSCGDTVSPLLYGIRSTASRSRVNTELGYQCTSWMD